MAVPPSEFRTVGLMHHCAPTARHSDDAARAAILFLYVPRFYDVIGFIAFSSLPLVGFCWTVEGKG